MVKKCQWIDRLSLDRNLNWIDYISNDQVDLPTSLKIKSEIAGYFELLSHSKQSKEVEIAYFGIIRRIFKMEKN